MRSGFGTCSKFFLRADFFSFLNRGPCFEYGTGQIKRTLSNSPFFFRYSPTMKTVNLTMFFLISRFHIQTRVKIHHSMAPVKRRKNSVRRKNSERALNPLLMNWGLFWAWRGVNWSKSKNLSEMG